MIQVMCQSVHIIVGQIGRTVRVNSPPLRPGGDNNYDASKQQMRTGDHLLLDITKSRRTGSSTIILLHGCVHKKPVCVRQQSFYKQQCIKTTVEDCLIATCNHIKSA